MMKVAAAFVKSKREFGPVLKSKLNPHLKNKYADLASCLSAVEDALLTNGIAVMQETSNEAGCITVETVFLHESGEMIRGGKFGIPAAKQDAQSFGSALTYARRYSLLTACGIAPEDDDGNLATRKAEKFSVEDSIAVLNSAKDVAALNAFWKVEVAKFDPKGEDYSKLKACASSVKAALAKEVAHV